MDVPGLTIAVIICAIFVNVIQPIILGIVGNLVTVPVQDWLARHSVRHAKKLKKKLYLDFERVMKLSADPGLRLEIQQGIILTIMVRFITSCILAGLGVIFIFMSADLALRPILSSLSMSGKEMGDALSVLGYLFLWASLLPTALSLYPVQTQISILNKSRNIEAYWRKLVKRIDRLERTIASADEEGADS